jgi:hypothetical protein
MVHADQQEILALIANVILDIQARIVKSHVTDIAAVGMVNFHLDARKVCLVLHHIIAGPMEVVIIRAQMKIQVLQIFVLTRLSQITHASVKVQMIAIWDLDYAMMMALVYHPSNEKMELRVTLLLLGDVATAFAFHKPSQIHRHILPHRPLKLVGHQQ